MPYQVIARRWRPQTFDELIGQDHITNTLRNAIEKKKIAQAYLFSGPRGVGKTSGARIFAKALNCQNGGPTPQPCGTCDNCREIADGNAIDVLEIDGASNRGIDQIRDLQMQVRYLPTKCNYKIYYIDEVHMLTTEAFNALLKTLEEPPRHVIFIFATTEPNKVKDTIRSRCQHYNFRRLTVDTILKQLQLICEQDTIHISDAALYLVARAGDGSMRDAEQALDQVIAFSGDEITQEEVHLVLGLVREEYCIQFIQRLIEKDLAGLIQLALDVMNSGYALVNYAQELIAYIRHLILIKNVDAEAYAQLFYFTPEQIKTLEPFKIQFTQYQLNEIMNHLIKLHRDLKDTTNEQYTFESYLYRLVDYENFINLSNLISRIEQLETKGWKTDASAELVEATPSLSTSIPKSPSQKTIEQSAPTEPSPSNESPTQSDSKSTDPDSSNVLSEAEKNKALADLGLPENYFAHWIKELEKNKDKAFLAASLKHVSSYHLQPEKKKLVLKFPSEFYYTRCNSYRTDLENHFATVYNLSVEIVMSVDSAAKKGKRDSSEKTESQILELFDGEIIV